MTHYDFDGNATYYDESDGIPIYALSIFIDEDYTKWISSTLGLSKMDLQNEVGSITKGKLANLIITKPVESYGFLPYAFGSDCI